jgi:hypothetical protein
MPELPSQPNLDHLRHQARRLLREAQAGHPGALERMGAWSTRLTLSAAQLAVAREYGWRSWDAIRHYVEALASIAERRHSPPTATDHEFSSGVPTGVRRGDGEIVLRGGTLRPGTLIDWGSYGVLEAEFASSLLARQIHGALDAVVVTDELGTDYGRCQIRMISKPPAASAAVGGSTPRQNSASESNRWPSTPRRPIANSSPNEGTMPEPLDLHP